ncbi:MAG: hypothetical protein IH801_06445, partial [Nitrospinae bacterium]|nr:hypothetical protein [Nitrospinota bacterium]
MINKQVTWIGLPRVMVAIVALAAVLALAPGQAQALDCKAAPPCVATDGNDSIEVDPTSQSGLDGWLDDGTDQFGNGQWFWFRDGAVAEASLDTLTLDSADATADVITLNFSGSGLAVTVVYDLDDLGVGRSRIRETVSIRNTSGGTIDLHWFEYIDLDINTTSGGETASINAAGNTITQDNGANTVAVLALPTPDHFDIDVLPSIVPSLNDGTPTTLDDTPIPGPADLDHAFQWDVTLPPGAVFNITIIKELNLVDSLTTLGHFLCYKTRRVRKTPRFSGTQLVLFDQFEDRSFKVRRRPRLLCTPADKNGGGIGDPANHLRSYRIKRTSGKPFRLESIEVNNQFGDLFVDIRREFRILVPTLKDPDNPVVLPDPFTPPIDHFKCYKVRRARGKPRFSKRTVTLKDQFITSSKQFLVKRPTTFCTPVDKNGEGILDEEAHLMCYKIRQTSKPRFKKVKGVHVDNQFNPPGQVNVKRPIELCV